MEKILVVVAHPDDEVLGMGGTIAKLVTQGKEVHLLIVTDGSSSQYGGRADLESILEAKKAETCRAAEILGICTVHYGELPDMRLDVTAHTEVNRVIEQVIDKVKPDTLFTHFWGDVNKDHRCVFESTLVAARPLAGQVVKELYCFSVPSSTEWTPCKADTMFMPNVFVEIDQVKELKYKAMAEYSTELRDYPHPRSVRHLQELDVAEGLRVGLRATESFVLLRKVVE